MIWNLAIGRDAPRARIKPPAFRTVSIEDERPLNPR
jgi:hypothetical protein